MSWNSGAGSPVFFICPVRRVEKRYGSMRDHGVKLTGRTKPYKTKKGSGLGIRSTTTSREYVCECGFTGWSNHVDLARHAARFGGES